MVSAAEVQDRLGLKIGEPLPQAPEQLARELERLHEKEGYAFARVEPVFDEATGRLEFRGDPGRVDEVEVVGVDEKFAREIAERVKHATGGLVHRPVVTSTVKKLLEKTEGAITLARDPYQLVDRGGKRVLVVNLRTRDGRAGLSFGTGAREDWFTPVGGYAPALGFSATAFDTRRFNHTYVEGYGAYRFGSEKWGYSLGLERPIWHRPKLFVGAEVHDILASDDRWRLSVNEQSLVAMAFRNSFRDYYRRRGYQVNAALRVHPQHEILASWQQDRHEGVFNETDFSFFRDDHPFRPNPSITEGRVHAGVFRYLWDSRALDGDRIRTTYRRHLLDDLYGSDGGGRPGWRFEWTTEVGRGDFDFQRHVVNLRQYARLSPKQAFDARLLAGFSGGTLPAQRLFGLGGIGSVHGYRFKETVGEAMVLLNAEYRRRAHERDPFDEWQGVLFLDLGRVYRPIPGAADEWLKAIGLGIEAGRTFRLEFGWRLDDIPRSLQVLVRFSRPF